MKKGYAQFQIIRDSDGNSAGYHVDVYEAGKPDPVDEYNAGDSHYDSKLFGTGDINESRLREMVQETAEGMLKENGLEGNIKETESEEE